jgi:hypothetical protein
MRRPLLLRLLHLLPPQTPKTRRLPPRLSRGENSRSSRRRRRHSSSSSSGGGAEETRDD